MACDVCYHRKVRCDLDAGVPCVACINSGKQCTFIVAEEHKVKRRARKVRLKNTSHADSETGVVTKVPKPSSEDISQHLHNNDSGTSSLIAVRGRSMQPTVPTEADIVEDTLAKTALTRFYHHGINKTDWTVFTEKGYTRIAYIGTQVSNLANLVQEEAHFTGSTKTYLHLPFPSIRPTMPWKPTKTMSSVKWHSSSFADDISALPAKDVRDDLVESFFTKIHPGFPVIDESEFRRQYQDPDNPPPLLLLQSVLLAGAHVSNHPKIMSSRALVKIVIFRRAKALFDMHYENDRMNLVQVALLFMWHFEGADDVSSNAYHWIGVACRIAFGLGMHRNLSSRASGLMPLNERRIYRRVWWTLYQIEILVSLQHGRPCMIQPDEIDQDPLTRDDFVEQNGQLNNNINIDYCIQNVSLCTIILSIIKMFTPGSMKRFHSNPESHLTMQDKIDQRLAAWYLGLPLKLTDFHSERPDFWTLQMHIHYNMALLHSHRPLAPSLDSIDLARRRTSSEACHGAASTISKCFTDLLSSNQLDQCWFTSLMALLATAIQINHEARSSARAGANILAIQAQSRLQRILPVLSAISNYWSSAVAVHNLYQDLLKQYKRQLQSSIDMGASHADPFDLPSYQQTPSSTAGAALESLETGDFFNGDWQALFGAGQVDNSPDINVDGVEDWLTMSVDLFGDAT
ncbi:hypothetical protein B0A52_01262 [Exophiala mesophila]|uniref:Zn(2)-C6 fungal-type domain-containing protein n=1 Tax=Exophiala mesophila TaxID=212818 RepID=A0A438NGX5_EXOME|nr:hypothetical protein B0A52_01262 [Exophiala mesophila]